MLEVNSTDASKNVVTVVHAVGDERVNEVFNRISCQLSTYLLKLLQIASS